MQSAFHTTTTVLPGGKIEIAVPELHAGQKVQVVLIPTPPLQKPSPPGLSALDITESLKGHRLFQTVEEVDCYINEEHDSWER